MHLQPAIALDQFVTAGFGDRESRQARREARRERRQKRKDARQEKRQEKKDDRKERRAERKVARIQRKKARVKSKLARTPGGSSATATATTSTSEPTLQPAPMTYMPQAQAMPMMPPGQQPTPWSDSTWDMEQEFDDSEFEPELDEGDEFEEATEGIGAWRPFQRARQALAPRGAEPSGPGGGAWGPSVRMGKTLRIQAAAGHRAAVIDLKPGLFLVAELPEAVTKSEFGVAPLLAPLMMTAARRAMNEPPRQRQGPLASLFRRRDEPVRYVEVQPTASVAPAAPLALPGPVADEPSSVVVPAPNVGWADDATVAAVYGCDECERVKR